MYKYILLLLLLSSTVFGQTTGKQLEFNSAWGVDYESNMVKNPSAAKNLNDTLKLGATLSRDTSAGNKIDGKASFLLDAGALNDYLELSLLNPSDEQTSGNCGFKGLFKGDARLYRAQILDGSSNVLAQTVPLTNETGFREFRVWYPCGASGARKVRITQTEAGTAPAINVGKFYYGRMEPGAGTSPNDFSAKVSGTGVLSDIVNPQYFNGTTFAPTDTSLFTISLKNLTSVPTCQVVGLQGTTDAPLVKIASQSTSSVVVRTYTDSAGSGVKVAYAFNISCTKTGSDYIQPAITPQNFDTDWATCPSISGSWTGGTYSCKYMHQGPNTHYDISFVASGAASGSTLTFTLPFTIDTAKMNNPVAGFSSLSGGDSTLEDNSSAGGYKLYAVYNGPTSVLIAYQSATNAAASGVTPTAPITIANLDKINVKFSVPTVGRSASQGAPQLVGSVTSNSNNALRTISGLFAGGTPATNCTTSPCTIYADYGGISSVTRGGTGAYVVNFSNSFQSIPVCTCSCIENGVSYRACGTNAANTTSANFVCNDGTTSKDATVNFTCVGPR